LEHAPVVQNQGLRGTSAWANSWLGRDHTAKKVETVANGAILENKKPVESKI
jgi:hypothetical protein